jgi:hypothetical protein
VGTGERERLMRGDLGLVERPVSARVHVSAGAYTARPHRCSIAAATTARHRAARTDELAAAEDVTCRRGSSGL